MNFRNACINPWLLGPDGMCVQLFKIGKTWHEARDHCRSLEGGEKWKFDLVKVLNEKQNEWLGNLISNNYVVWIGANNLDVDGQFKWSSNGNIISFANWGQGEPNEGSNEGSNEDKNEGKNEGTNEGSNENCVLISFYDQKWHDWSCNKNLYFFCQMETSL